MVFFRIFTVGDWRKRCFEIGPGWLTVWRLLNSLPVRAVLTALMRESFGTKRVFSKRNVFIFFLKFGKSVFFLQKSCYDKRRTDTYCKKESLCPESLQRRNQTGRFYSKWVFRTFRRILKTQESCRKLREWRRFDGSPVALASLYFAQRLCGSANFAVGFRISAFGRRRTVVQGTAHCPLCTSGSVSGACVCAAGFRVSVVGRQNFSRVAGVSVLSVAPACRRGWIRVGDPAAFSRALGRCAKKPASSARRSPLCGGGDRSLRVRILACAGDYGGAAACFGMENLPGTEKSADCADF